MQEQFECLTPGRGCTVGGLSHVDVTGAASSQRPRGSPRSRDVTLEKKISNDQIKIEIKKAEALPAKAETAEIFPRSIPQAQYQ